MNKPDIIKQGRNVILTDELKNYMIVQYNLGNSTRDIARDLRLSNSWVTYTIKDFGIMRDNSDSKRALFVKFRNNLSKNVINNIIDRYNSGESVVSIASAIELSVGRVNAILEEFSNELKPSEAIVKHYDVHSKARNRKIIELDGKILSEEEINEKIKEMYLSGKSLYGVANELGASKSWVGRIAGELGIMRDRHVSEQNKYRDKYWRNPEFIEKVKKLYVENKMNIAEICDMLNSSYNMVRQIIFENGLMRTPSDGKNYYYERHSDVKEQIRETLTGTTRPEEVKMKISNTEKGKFVSQISRAKMSASHTGVPLSPSHRDAVVKSVVRASHKRPNEEEIAVGKLLERLCPGRFQYNGGCELGITIGYRVPDYIDVQNCMVVLFNGCWYHSCPQCFPNGNKFSLDSVNRNDISAYTDNGYKCLVIWGHELFRSIAEQKVLEFIR